MNSFYHRATFSGKNSLHRKNCATEPQYKKFRPIAFLLNVPVSWVVSPVSLLLSHVSCPLSSVVEPLHFYPAPASQLFFLYFSTCWHCKDGGSGSSSSLKSTICCWKSFNKFHLSIYRGLFYAKKGMSALLCYSSTGTLIWFYIIVNNFVNFFSVNIGSQMELEL